MHFWLPFLSHSHSTPQFPLSIPKSHFAPNIPQHRYVDLMMTLIPPQHFKSSPFPAISYWPYFAQHKTKQKRITKLQNKINSFKYIFGDYPKSNPPIICASILIISSAFFGSFPSHQFDDHFPPKNMSSLFSPPICILH